MKYSIKGILDNPEKKKDDLGFLLKYVYGISDLETKIVELLLSPANIMFEQEGTCIGYISKILNKDRSLIQRCLGKLMKTGYGKQGMVTRKKKPLKEWQGMCEGLEFHDPNLHGTSSKGYLYIYKAVSIAKIKKMLLETHSQGYNLVNSQIEQL